MVVLAVGGADLLPLLVLGGILGAILGSAVVCGLKGKYGMVAGGILVHPLWVVGAIRLAKPDSWWARRNYEDDKLVEARARAVEGGFLHAPKPAIGATPTVAGTDPGSPRLFALLDRRAHLAFAGLTIVALVDLASIFFDLAEIRLVQRLDGGDVSSLVSFDTADHRRVLVSYGYDAAVLACAFFFIPWFTRAYRNLFPLGVQELRWSEGWAIGAWFVPVLNLWRPKQIANDIWRGSSAEAPSPQGDGWRAAAVPALFALWWGGFLFSRLGGLVAGNRASGAESLPALRSALILDIVALVVAIAAAFLAATYVRRTSSRQKARAIRLGLLTS